MAKSSKTVRVNCGAKEAINSAQIAIQLCKWKIYEIDNLTLKAKTSISLTSWGERILIRAKEINGQTLLNISSEFILGLFDLSNTNQKNISKVILNLRKYCEVFD